MRKVETYEVDYTRKEARQLLSNSPARLLVRYAGPDFLFKKRKKYNELQVFIDDVWMSLARTDLKDDVCTSDYWEFSDVGEALEFFVKEARYGARVKRYKRKIIFAVIDNFSDG